jgi:hypothetical protein
MITLYDSGSGTKIGEISQAQLEALIHWMEEEFENDRDYYISAEELELMEEDGVDAALLGMLKKALAGRNEMDVRYETE